MSTVNLNCKLDLKKIALHARNAEYNPKRFAAVIMRIREPRTTALIFSSGKMVCTGAKSEEDSRLAARKYARIIQKLGFTVSALIIKLFVQYLTLQKAKIGTMLPISKKILYVSMKISTMNKFIYFLFFRQNF